METLRRSLTILAVESWRLSRAFEKTMESMDPETARRQRSRLKWFLKKTEEALNESDLRLVDLTGREFDPGLAVTALNIDDFAPEDRLVISQMVEPVIMDGRGVLKAGTAILEKLDTPAST